jgi:hypothetical protein
VRVPPCPHAGEPLAKVLQGGFGAGDESPSGARAEGLAPSFELRGRVGLGVGADDDEEDLAAQPLAERGLKLRQKLTLRRAGVDAARVDEADDRDLVFDEVGVKTQPPAVLVEDLFVGQGQLHAVELDERLRRGNLDGVGLREGGGGRQREDRQQAEAAPDRVRRKISPVLHSHLD